VEEGELVALGSGWELLQGSLRPSAVVASRAHPSALTHRCPAFPLSLLSSRTYSLQGCRLYVLPGHWLLVAATLLLFFQQPVSCLGSWSLRKQMAEASCPAVQLQEAHAPLGESGWHLHQACAKTSLGCSAEKLLVPTFLSCVGSRPQGPRNLPDIPMRP
jgi:hypothetical protein